MRHRAAVIYASFVASLFLVIPSVGLAHKEMVTPSSVEFINDVLSSQLSATDIDFDFVETKKASKEATYIGTFSAEGEFFISVEATSASLTVTHAQGQLSSRHLRRIKTALQSLQGSTLEEAPIIAAKNMTLFMSMLPAREELSPILDFQHPRRSLWTMICDQVGKTKMGSYEVDGQVFYGYATVGERDTNCHGRCGSGCGRKAKYTKQCFDHDLCRRETGENLGVCSAEFMAAAYGYTFAPFCNL